MHIGYVVATKPGKGWVSDMWFRNESPNSYFNSRCRKKIKSSHSQTQLSSSSLNKQRSYIFIFK